MKKRLTVVISVCLLVGLLVLFTGCVSGENNRTADGEQNQVKTIGIVQIVEHPSLNTIRECFVQQLEELGFIDGQNIRIDYQNAQNDQTNLKTICQKFAHNHYDLILAIATPSAQAAIGETRDIPVVFSACTDPLGSGLVSDMNQPGQNVTGTSDAVSAEAIMSLAMQITPHIKTIGALYNSSETNSISVINNLKEYAANNGLTVVEATVTNSSEVQQATQSLAGKVDAIFSPIDNTVASAMPVAAQVARKARLPVYVGADSMVKDGGLATCGINYKMLGQETANMAAEILHGKPAGEIPVKVIKDYYIYVNQDTARSIGVTIPEQVLAEAAEVFDNN
ncbi:MAG TPA: ABC transporter substrate-binding protein [Firmicutes bacterium]|nr:ABC transporter substrate-binding protein [Bacillota bacterium]